MPPSISRSWLLVLALCLGSYGLAFAQQPEENSETQPTQSPSSEGDTERGGLAAAAEIERAARLLSITIKEVRKEAAAAAAVQTTKNGATDQDAKELLEHKLNQTLPGFRSGGNLGIPGTGSSLTLSAGQDGASISTRYAFSARDTMFFISTETANHDIWTVDRGQGAASLRSASIRLESVGLRWVLGERGRSVESRNKSFNLQCVQAQDGTSCRGKTLATVPIKGFSFTAGAHGHLLGQDPIGGSLEAGVQYDRGNGLSPFLSLVGQVFMAVPLAAAGTQASDSGAPARRTLFTKASSLVGGVIFEETEGNTKKGVALVGQLSYQWPLWRGESPNGACGEKDEPSCIAGEVAVVATYKKGDLGINLKLSAFYPLGWNSQLEDRPNERFDFALVPSLEF